MARRSRRGTRRRVTVDQITDVRLVLLTLAGSAIGMFFFEWWKVLLGYVVALQM